MPSISIRKSTRNSAAVAVLYSAALANAIVTPNLPYGGVVDRTGSDCQIGWAADTTGAWNSMDIELMTGDNFNFVHLAWVARGVDGTGATNSYTWTCPDVTINAPIYFYQFTQTGQDATYTTRFTIAAADGTTVPAPNATQPGGQAIPWGVGAIVGGSPDSGTGSSSGSNGSSSTGSGSSSGTGSSSASSLPGSSSSSNTPTTGSSASASSSASSDDSSAASADTTVVTVQPSSSSTIRRMSSSSQPASATSGVTAGNSANRGNSTAGSSDTGAASAQVGGSSIAGIGMALALAIAGLAFA